MDGFVIFIILMIVFQIGVFVCVVTIIVTKAGKGISRRPLAMEKLGGRVGLELRGGESRYPGNPLLKWIRTPYSLNGYMGPYPTRVYHYVVSSGKSSTTYACACLTISNSRRKQFTLSREHLFSKVGKGLGMQDIQAGDRRFDEEILIKGNAESFIRIGLVDSIKDKLLDLFEARRSSGTIELKKEELKYYEAGQIADDDARERFEIVLEILVDLAASFDVFETAFS